MILRHRFELQSAVWDEILNLINRIYFLFSFLSLPGYCVGNTKFISRFEKLNCNGLGSSVSVIFLGRVHVTLHLSLSVGPSVGPSVCPLVSPKYC